jgi:N-acetylmuramoyl-L-alanine amidase
VRGDTLGEIASRYRISLYRLRLANNLKSDNIRVGAQLLIPTT